MSVVNYAEIERQRNLDAPANIRSYSESRILDFVNERIRAAREGKVWQTMRDNYSDYRRAYEGKFKYASNVPRWRNRMYVRLSFKIVETLRAYFDDALFGRKPYTMLFPEHDMFKKNAENMEAVMQHEAEITKKRLKMMHVINSTLKHGVGISRSFWDFQRGIRPVRQFQRDPNGFFQHLKQVEREYVKRDSPNFHWVDPAKMAFDPQNWMTDDMRYAVEEFDMDLDSLVNGKDFYGYMNLDEVAKDSRSGYPAGSELNAFGADPHNQADYIGTLSEDERRTWDHTRKRVSIMRYEGKLDMPGNNGDPRMYEVYIANQRTVIKVRRSPYAFDKISYNIHNIMPQEDSYVGIGAIEPILTDQRILNILVNIRLDSLHLLISPRLLAHKNSLERGIKSIANVAPGEVINVKNAADLSRVIRPMDMPDQGFNTWHQFWQQQNQHAEETLAMSPNARGMLAQSKHSATEVVRSLEAANARFLHMVNIFTETGYNDQVYKEMSMIQQFMEKKKWVKITGDPNAGEIYRDITPFDIQGDFMFERHDPTKFNKEMETQLFTQLLTAFAPYFQLMQQVNPNITPVPFLKGILEASPIAKQLPLQQMFPDTQGEAADVLNNESASLEKAFSGDIPGQGTQPGGAAPGGRPPVTIPDGEGTALGIAKGGI